MGKVKAKELKENEKAEVEPQMKVELSKNDTDQLMTRERLIGSKQRDMQKLQLEVQMLSREVQMYYGELFEKYGLPSDKKFHIQGGFLVEVLEAEE